MKDHRAIVVEVEISKHPNADRLELAPGAGRVALKRISDKYLLRKKRTDNH